MKMPFRMFQRPARAALTVLSAIAIASIGLAPLGITPAFASLGGPSYNVAPALSAEYAQVGVPISTDNGSWTTSGGTIDYAYQWDVCNIGGCAAIQLATNSGYTPQAGDVGNNNELIAIVFAHDDNGTVEQGSNRARIEDTPANTFPPAVSGTTIDGETLSVDSGTFTGGWLSSTYQWQRCSATGTGCSNIPAATDSEYALASADLGHRLRAIVTAQNDVDSASRASAATAVIAAPANPPAAPELTAISTGDHSITVAFANDETGGPITDDTALCISNDGGDPGSSDGASPITITGLTLHKHYTCAVVATNGAGVSAPSRPSDSEVVPTFPDAPTGVAAQRGNSTIRVAFTELNGDDTPPSNNDSPLEGYRATCTSSDGGTGNDSFDTSSPIDVTGLDNGHQYTCSVHAINDVGNSVESAPSNVVVPDLVPDPASIDGVDTSAGTRQVQVSFSPGTDNGTPVTDFSVHCGSNDGGDPASNDGTGSPIVVTGLTDGATYACTVVATNDLGDSFASDPSDPFKAAEVPDAPTITGVARHGTAGGHLDVSFSNNANNGSKITDNHAVCTSDDGGNPGNADGASPITVNGLTDGATYTCYVSATNGIGDSGHSKISDRIVSASVPEQVDQPSTTLNVDDARALDVSFSELVGANTGGIKITDYAVDCTSNNGGTERTGDGGSSPITVSGLDKGHEYTCTITARNDVGAGDVSDPSNSLFIPVTTPDQPAQPTAVRHGSGTLTVGWTAPYDGGEAIAGFGVNCTSNDGGASDSKVALANATSMDATDLDNGHHYSCTVIATNGHGDSSRSPASASVLVAGAPAEPTIGTATRSVGAGVDVTFNANATNGSPVTSNTATCTSSNGGTTRSGSNGGAPIHVSTLTTGADYKCTVHSTNIAGDSSESAASDSFVAADVPGPPTSVNASASDGNIAVTFSGASDNGEPIDSYVVTCTSNDGGRSGDNSGASSPITVSALENAHEYACVARAHNALGSGIDSGPSNTVVPDVVPDEPTVTDVTRFSPNSAHVAFTAGVDNGTSVTDYAATCSSSDGTTQTGDADSAPIDVVGLTNGASYTCTVHATNQKGDSAESSTSNSFTAAAVPGIPTITSVTPDDSEISVAFTAPASNGAPITDDTAQCVSSDGGTENRNHSTTSPITVTGVTNGNTYTCTVVATNDMGNGDASDPSASVVVGPAPANTALPMITGTAIEQRPLNANDGSWSGASDFTHQWQRCDKNGANCVDIAGATDATRVLSHRDVDHRLRVVVTGTNAVSSVSATSAATPLVETVPVSISGPYYYDGAHVFQAPNGSVGAATHGSSVWVVYPNGNLTGPHFAPGDGTLVGTDLVKPIIGIVATPSGKGYWMFAGDGGVFTFGDAHFYGSTGGMPLNAPIVSMAGTPSGRGYWLFGADGGVFTFGDAVYHGSTGSQQLAHAAVAMLATPSGRGYWIVTADGQAIPFGDATDIGSITSLHRTDIVGLVSTNAGYRFVTNTLALLTPT